MSRSILVIAYDREQDGYSLEKAHFLASPLDATLEIVRFLPSLDSDDDVARTNAISQAKQVLVNDIYEIFGDDDRVSSDVVSTDDISSWVVAACSEKHFDLVIKTGHRTESLFHTPTDWTLMRQLSCPILITNNHKWKSKQVVLATVDLAAPDLQHKERNEEVLKWTTLISQTLHYAPHIVYSVPIARSLVELEVVDKEKYLESNKFEAENQLSKLLENFELGQASTQITAGPPEKTIPHVANELKADLVIMGCKGREGIKGFLFGSTAEKVLHHLRTDILLVKYTGD
jgi:universal stress protein E